MDLRRCESGITLVEAMVVIVLAGVVTIGLLGFYLNSQATWMDGSSQALAQRDATLLLEGIAADAREAASFSIVSSSNETTLTFFAVDTSELSQFSWHVGTDSLMYHSVQGGPAKAVVGSIVETFQPSADALPSVLHVDELRLRSADGARITTSTAFGLNNAP